MGPWTPYGYMRTQAHFDLGNPNAIFCRRCNRFILGILPVELHACIDVHANLQINFPWGKIV